MGPCITVTFSFTWLLCLTSLTGSVAARGDERICGELQQHYGKVCHNAVYESQKNSLEENEAELKKRSQAVWQQFFFGQDEKNAQLPAPVILLGRGVRALHL